jgi:hypothetical protein
LGVHPRRPGHLTLQGPETGVIDRPPSLIRGRGFQFPCKFKRGRAESPKETSERVSTG